MLNKREQIKWESMRKRLKYAVTSLFWDPRDPAGQPYWPLAEVGEQKAIILIAAADDYLTDDPGALSDNLIWKRIYACEGKSLRVEHIGTVMGEWDYFALLRPERDLSVKQWKRLAKLVVDSIAGSYRRVLFYGCRAVEASQRG